MVTYRCLDRHEESMECARIAWFARRVASHDSGEEPTDIMNRDTMRIRPGRMFRLKREATHQCNTPAILNRT